MALVADQTFESYNFRVSRPQVGLWEYMIYSPVIEVTAIYLYYIRDCFAGFFRYFLAMVHLDPLWFIPDAFAFVCAALFFIRFTGRGGNMAARFLMCYLPISIIIAMIFFRDMVATSSGVKMFMPAFVGLCFAGRRISDMRSIRFLFYLVFAMSAIGILWNSVQRLPWEGFAYQGLGVGARNATRLWWSGEERRLGGFAADSTMAGYFLMAGFAAIVLNFKYIWRLPLAVLAIYATQLSTSKTSLIIIIVMAAVMLVTGLFGKQRELAILKHLSKLSYLSILVPYVLIIFASGIDLTSINQKLFSMQDRINNSWVLPFQYMGELFPLGFTTGCGIGCFNYPQQLFPTAVQQFWVPVDNFYMGTYLMFGMPFLLLLFLQVFKNNTDDPMKIVQTICMNLFGTTVLCYGPASSLILFGILFSNLFLSKEYLKRASVVEDYISARRMRGKIPGRQVKWAATRRI